MRWPFRRRETEPATPSPKAASVAAAADPANAAPAGPPAWSEMPPLQRTLDGTTPLTASPTGMLGDLAERWAPGTVLEPLGHEIGGLGPAGTIGLAGGPIEAGGRRPELIGRPGAPPPTIQRAAVGPAWPSFPDAEPAPTAPAVLPPAPAPRRAPVIEPAAAAAPVQVQRSLTSAADPIGHVDLPLPRVGSPAPAEEPLEEQASMSSAPMPSASPAAPEVASVQRSSIEAAPGSIGQPRRAGLGAPLAGGLPVQRTAPLTRHERPHRVPVQRRSLDDLPVARPPARTAIEADEPRAADPPGVPAAAPPPADAPAQPSPVVEPAPTAVLTGTIDVSRLAAEDRPAADPLRVLTRPLAGRLEPIVQRSADDAADAGPGEVSVRQSSVAEPSVAPVQRSPSASLTDPRASGPQRGTPLAHPRPQPDTPVVTRPGPPTPFGGPSSAPTLTVARTAAPDAPTRAVPPVVRPIAGSPGTRQLAATAAVQRAAVSPAIAPTTRAQPPHLPLAARPQEGPPAAPIVVEVQRAAEPSMTVTAPATQPQMPLVESGMSTGPAGAIEGEAEPWPEIAIQRAAADDAQGSAPAPAATSTPGGGPVAGASDKDLDELARRLYERIRRRLSRELLADRERAGMLTDLR